MFRCSSIGLLFIMFIARRSTAFLSSSSPALVGRILRAGRLAMTTTNGNKKNLAGAAGYAVFHLAGCRGGALFSRSNGAAAASSPTRPSTTALFSTAAGAGPYRTEPPSVGKLEGLTGIGENFQGDLLVLPVFQPEEGDSPAVVKDQAILAAWDEKLDGAIEDLIKMKEFKGKAESLAKVRLGRSSSVKSIALVGLGKQSTFKSARALGSTAAADIKAEKPKTVAVVLPAAAGEGALESAAEDLLSGLYYDKRYKTGEGVEKPPVVESVQFFNVETREVDKALKTAKAFAEGIRLTKDLVGAPANYVTPRALADTAREIGQEYGWEVKVLGLEECQALKMGAYLAVAQGSKDGPEFIHMTYKPKSGPAAKKLVLIGKGLTFDSGGYNLKAGAGSMIEMMKFDMGGAGAVLGAAKALAEIEPSGVEVHVIIAACENMISDRAYRPGDILTASNGKTIEVLNTDAEGRLTLADALVYAEKLEPDAIVDSATLTGACIIALGGDYGGMWSGDDALAKALEDAAKAKGEKIWRMPLADEYKPNIKSEIADLKNVGGREGGSITAALFLAEFVKKTPWAHLDIAGPVWNPKKGGATGFGARTLAQWVISQSS